MRPDSLHLLNSVSKSFIGMLVGILVDDGLIDPRALVTTYIPEFALLPKDTPSFRQRSNRLQDLVLCNFLIPWPKEQRKQKQNN